MSTHSWAKATFCSALARICGRTASSSASFIRSHGINARAAVSRSSSWRIAWKSSTQVEHT